jgi:hypothetical protein
MATADAAGPGVKVRGFLLMPGGIGGMFHPGNGVCRLATRENRLRDISADNSCHHRMTPAGLDYLLCGTRCGFSLAVD